MLQLKHCLYFVSASANNTLQIDQQFMLLTTMFSQKNAHKTKYVSYGPFVIALCWTENFLCYVGFYVNKYDLFYDF